MAKYGKFRSPLCFWHVLYIPATVTQSKIESGGYAEGLDMSLV